MTAIFLYGTLRDPHIRQHVFADSIRDDQLRDARVEGYRTMTYPGESFPVLVRAPDSVAHGLLLLDPCAEALERMAFYEGDLYRLDDLQVIVADGETVQARYNRANEEDLALEEEWCYFEWQSRWREAFAKTSEQYMRRCWGEDLSEAEADAVWQELASREEESE